MFYITGDVSKAPRPVSAGTLSSNEDIDEQDSNVASFEQSEFEITMYFQSVFEKRPILSTVPSS